MRSVSKGSAPKTYKKYRDAEPDLTERIGKYCSYCEKGLSDAQSRHVEHIIPKIKKEKLTLVWDNFLLACPTCNQVKWDNNEDRTNYLWPDVDNTYFAFTYDFNTGMIKTSSFIENMENIKLIAQATIALVGLDRKPGHSNFGKKDYRYRERIEAVSTIKESLENWNNAPSNAMAIQIALTAKGLGYYSLWMHYFKDYPQVIAEIEKVFPGTYHPQYDKQKNLIIRKGGTF